MEKFDKLFRDAERLKPPRSMWLDIAAKAGIPAPAARSGSFPEEKGEGAEDTEGVEKGRESPPWRLAASMAIGLGALAALFVVMREPGGLAGRWGGSGDSLVTAAASGQMREEDGLLDPELLDWHADLGEESAAEWESDPAMPDLAGEGLEDVDE